MQYFIFFLIALSIAMLFLASFVLHNIIIFIFGIILALFGILALIFKPKYKKCNIRVYINGELTNNLYEAEIKEVISPVVYLEYIYDNDVVRLFNISDSMILVSKDPMIAKILPSGKHIKTNTIADNCIIMIKNKGLKFWKCLKNYSGLIINVRPGPPYHLEIIEK